ncbi:MAG: amino acid ABC transporter permease [Clostridia bacterium]|nr:amino acid ABC transporter permease [Clostridia bacterium]
MEWFLNTDLWKAIYSSLIEGNRWKALMSGLGTTLTITLGAMLLGTVLGILFALMKISKVKFLKWLSSLYIDVIRGTPVVVQLLIMYFVVFASVNINKTLIAIIAFGMNSGAYVAEIIRAGILGVDKGQMESGRSLGLTHSQTMVHIIMPQAIKNILPTYANEFIVLVKETAVAGYIAIEDLTKMGDIIRSKTYEALIPLLIVALIYLIITSILSRLFRRLERRMRASDNR